MATTGTLLVYEDNDEKNGIPIYRCCDFFIDEMKELIEETFKSWHSKLIEGYESSQCNPIMIASTIYAVKWESMKAGSNWHMCISLFDPCCGGGMKLNVTDPYKWILEYTDWDTKDNEIRIIEELSKKGWKKRD